MIHALLLAAVLPLRAAPALDCASAGGGPEELSRRVRECTRRIDGWKPESGAEELLGLKLRRAELHALAGSWGPAAADFEAVLKLDPENDDAHSGYAQALVAQNQEPRALAHFGKAIQSQPDHWVNYALRSEAHRRLGDLESAKNDARTAIELNAEGFLGHHALGRAEFDAERFEKARESLEKAELLAPAGDDEPLPMALTLVMLGRKEEARPYWQRAVARRPRLADGLAAARRECGYLSKPESKAYESALAALGKRSVPTAEEELKALQSR